MKLLLVLLATMTFTVQSKTSVKADGEWPYSMGATYANTGSKGNVTDHDTATLLVTGLGGITIDAIEVYVNSNKNSGAGTFTVTADGQTIATKSGTLADWFGAYNNTDYQPLSLLSSAQSGVNNLVITLTGTESSLHIEKYAISWSQSQAQPHTVTLMRGSSVYGTQTEQQGGAGVMLPKLLDEDDWHFVAWTAEPFQTMHTKPSSWIEPGMWHPTADCTLWAVYEYQAPLNESIVTDLADGAYVYANWTSKKAMSGGIADGVAGSADVDLNDINQWYSVTFLTDSTATIQLMYTYEYIGFSGTQLSSEQSEWKVFHNGPWTAFYTEINNKAYMLWPDYLKSEHGEYEQCAALIPVSNVSSAPTVLLSIEPVLDEPWYTCYPEAQGVEEVNGEWTNGERTNEWRIPFGQYELIIKDGKKYLRLK